MYPCRICGAKNANAHYCIGCEPVKHEAVQRFVSGAFTPGDETLLNLGAGSRPRVSPEGLLRCAKCDEYLPVDHFRMRASDTRHTLPFQSWCRRCNTIDNSERRSRSRGGVRPAPIMVLPRNRPPGNDAGRQLRDVLEQLSKITPRLESLCSVGSLDAFGDEAERLVLAKHMHRIVATANDLLAALSGMNTDGEQTNDRTGAIRRIR